MEIREAGLTALYERIKAQRESIGVKTFIRNPGRSAEESDLLVLFMFEGRDVIIERSSRGWLGYPCRRELEVTLEAIATAGFDIRAFYRRLRTVVLSDPVLSKGCAIRETRAEGPMNYARPNTIGMQMVLSMTYMDDGT